MCYRPFQALRDLDEVLTPALALRRKQRETLGAAYYDASVYSQSNLARLPEALRPKPGRMSAGQQRVYEVGGKGRGEGEEGKESRRSKGWVGKEGGWNEMKDKGRSEGGR